MLAGDSDRSQIFSVRKKVPNESPCNFTVIGDQDGGGDWKRKEIEGGNGEVEVNREEGDTETDRLRRTLKSKKETLPSIKKKKSQLSRNRQHVFLIVSPFSQKDVFQGGSLNVEWSLSFTNNYSFSWLPFFSLSLSLFLFLSPPLRAQWLGLRQIMSHIHECEQFRDSNQTFKSAAWQELGQPVGKTRGNVKSENRHVTVGFFFFTIISGASQHRKHSASTTEVLLGAPYRSFVIIQISGSPEIPNWCEKTLITPLVCSRAHAPTSDGLRAGIFSFAGTVRISALKGVNNRVFFLINLGSRGFWGPGLHQMNCSNCI